jgi:SAM-dependent methyltransferase
MVKCFSCDLVYSPNPPSVSELAQAYHQADFDSGEEANDAALSYIREIKNILMRLPQKETALEIGCGSGIFLEHLQAYGFQNLIGIEPSISAIKSAPNRRHEWIRHGVFEDFDLKLGSFDLICCFMTLEHVRSPGLLTQSANRLLRKGGAFIIVTHDYNSFVNKLLGRRSPIIDIEHLQLFNQKSIYRMLQINGFENILIKKFANYYRIKYWLRLAPFPQSVKKFIFKIFFNTKLLSFKVGINVGNTISIGYKV